MIKIENESCSLCQEEIPKKRIVFSCFHSICMKCFPYLWYNILDTQGLNMAFFTMNQQKIKCPLCSSGLANLPENTSEYVEYLQNYEFHKESRSEPICGGCNKQMPGIRFCVDCNKNFCDECYHMTHSVINYKKHVLLNSENHKCRCGFKKNLNKFCLSCKSAICDTCHVAIHKTHGKILNLFDIEAKLGNISSDEIKKDFKTFENEFNEFQLRLYDLLEQKFNNFNKDLQKKVNSLIDLLRSTQEKIVKKNMEIFDFFKNQVQITKLSISLISQEFDKLQKLHPNKKMFLGNFFNNEAKRKFFFADFKNMSIELENQKAMNQIIEETEKKIEKLLEINFQSKIIEDKQLIMSAHRYKISINNTYNNIQTIPTNLKQQTILENGSFYPTNFHGNQVCSFMIMNETYLAWPTILPMPMILNPSNNLVLENNIQNLFPVIIYNLSNNQREKILESNNKNEIKCLGTFPKDSVDFCSKRWLYFGDQRGILHFFDISKKASKFQKVGEIVPSFQKPILSVCISSNNSNSDDNIATKIAKTSEIYCFTSFSEKGSPIFIYQYDEIASSWIWYKKLTPPYYELCSMINFYYDDFLKKNFYFFAFSKSFVRMYDLKQDIWHDLKFLTDDTVTSLNIFSKKPNSSSEIIIDDVEKKDYFVLYTQLNSTLFVGDIQKGTIILRKELPHPKPSIYDLCIWKNFESYDQNDIFILSNSLKNNLKVMYFGNQEISTIKVKGTQKSVINIIKSIKNERECLVCFSYDKTEADKSSIVCIHNE